MTADCYKTKSIKRSEQLSIKRDQSEKIYIASLLSKVPSDFHNSILRKSDNKKQVFELIFEYTEREAYFFLEPLGSSEITLLSEKKMHFDEYNCTKWTFTSLIISRRTWYKTYCTFSSNIKRKFFQSVHPFFFWWYWCFTRYSSSSVRIWTKNLHNGSHG